MRELGLVQAPFINHPVFLVFDIDHGALLFGFPLVMLIDLPSSDEVDSKLLSSQGEVAPIPGESMVIDIGELLHQHPDLMRALCKWDNGYF